MNLFNRRQSRPIDRVLKVLARPELNWLYSIKPRWDANDTITIIEAPGKYFLDWEVRSHSMEGKSSCFVHIECDSRVETILVELEGIHRTRFEVFEKLYRANVNLAWVKYMATTLEGDDEVRIYYPPRGFTFEDLFMADYRYTGGNYQQA